MLILPVRLDHIILNQWLFIQTKVAVKVAFFMPVRYSNQSVRYRAIVKTGV